MRTVCHSAELLLWTCWLPALLLLRPAMGTDPPFPGKLTIPGFILGAFKPVMV